METSIEHFREHGWMRVPDAFGADEAAAMCDVIWTALGDVGFRRDDPTTWTQERPAHLQHLKTDPVFSAVGSERTRAAIDAILDGQAWRSPKNWGAFFLQFPTAGEWGVPTAGWHVDTRYDGRLAPACGVKVHAMLNDVEPGGGGMNILSGSHRLLHRWFSEHPAAPGAQRDAAEVVDGAPLLA